MSTADLLPAGALASLRRLRIPGWSPPGTRGGLHRVPRPGGGQEHLDHRPYEPGDELRHVDWRASARGNRVVVRRHHAERQRSLTILADRPHPDDLAGERRDAWMLGFAARLFYVAVQSGDRFAWVDRPDALTFARPGGGQAHLHAWLRSASTSGPAPVGQLLAITRASLKAGAHLVVLSDLHDLRSDPSQDHDDAQRAFVATLRGLIAQRVRVTVLRVEDDAELSLLEHTAPHVTLEDPRAFTAQRQVVPSEADAGYRVALAQWHEKLRSELRSIGCHYFGVNTQQDPTGTVVHLCTTGS